MVNLSILTDAAVEQKTVADGTTYLELFASNKEVVVVKRGEQLLDLFTEIQEGDEVSLVLANSNEGLAVLRHSTAHVLAQAVQALYKNVQLGIGPPVENGFYYDFQTETAFTPEDLALIESKMKEIIKSGQKFSRRVIDEVAAKDELSNEPFKLELIDIKGPSDEVMEVGGLELTIYDNLDKKSGEIVWKDLCRGPHVPNTSYLGAFKLMRTAAAYWRGSENNPQLQRVYGTAWANKEALNDYLHLLAEAEKRDHRKLGTELDLFSFPDEIGSGLAVFHPKGGVIRREMENYSRLKHENAAYEFVYSPHLTKAQLFETSGHLDWYSEGMYPPMKLDAEFDSEGNIKKAAQDYYLKPMNCPFHNLIYKSKSRSYRDLPLRLFEFGTVYRYEKSGVVHGLTRARGFTQDDAHIYTTVEDMQNELASLLTFVLDLLRDYGLSDFYIELSTRNPEKSVGSEAEWQQATEALAVAAKAQNLPVVMDEGGAAFYGPKISVQAKDALGRNWQMSTIQVDFQLPQRFDLEYQAADGSRKRPVMIHRALFGSIERFFAVLLEHYAGAFPPWLAPVQVVGIPIAETHFEYLTSVAQKLRAEGIRVEVDKSDERMQKKIRTAQKQKVPFMLIAGDEDVANNAVSFRYRDGSQENGVKITAAIEKIKTAIVERVQV
ncbi:MAG: threonine--tRNA ligase [Candidatus Nanopelagicales bacterium]